MRRTILPRPRELAEPEDEEFWAHFDWIMLALLFCVLAVVFVFRVL